MLSALEMAAWVTFMRPVAALWLLLAAGWMNGAVVDAKHEKKQYK